MTLNQEPTVIIGGVGELIRQLVPMLVLFGFVAWDDKQIAGVFMFTSAVLAFATILFQRSQVVSNEKANQQILTATRMPEGTSVEAVIAKTEAQSK